jgi:hypothetical protein
MNIKKKYYNISGGDDGAYGPIFGPVKAEEICVIKEDYVLLKLKETIQYKNDKIEYFVVAPRYKGDDINLLRKKGCIVGVARVLPNKVDNIINTKVIKPNIEYWSIGNCKPIKP